MTARIREFLVQPPASEQLLTRRCGRAVLLHLPPEEELQRVLFRLRASATLSMTQGSARALRTLAMLRAFCDMELVFFAHEPEGSALLGRADDSAVVVGDLSVSKLHARLSWDQWEFWLHDLGSTNGTFVNAVPLAGERALRDGDTVCLGDAQLLFVRTSTLYLQLESLRASVKVPSHECKLAG